MLNRTMKTTVRLEDSLFQDAKIYAVKHKITLGEAKSKKPLELRLGNRETIYRNESETSNNAFP